MTIYSLYSGAMLNGPEEPITLHVRSDRAGVKQHRGELARRVREYFKRNYDIPGRLRVICYLDDQDAPEVRAEFGGPGNRGLHWPINGQGLAQWPTYMWDVVAATDSVTGVLSWPFASIVYLHGSTCESDLDLTLTLSHELQHFLQYANQRRLWAINVLLMNLVHSGKPHLSKIWDVPIEWEARIASKQVAEGLFGTETVEQHVTSRIDAPVTESEAEHWKVFQTIDCSVAYSTAEATIRLVDLYRTELERLRSMPECQRDPDFAQLDFRCRHPPS